MAIYHSQYFEEARQQLVDSVPGTMGYTPIPFHAVGDDIRLDRAFLRFDWRAPEMFKQALATAMAGDAQFDRIGFMTRSELLLGQAALDYNGHFTLPTNELRAAIQKLTGEPVVLAGVAADLVLPFGLQDLRHVVHLPKWTYENHTLYHLVAGLPALEVKVDALRNAGVYRNEAKVLHSETELDGTALMAFMQDLIRDYFGVETANLRTMQAAFGAAKPNDDAASNRVLIADFEN